MVALPFKSKPVCFENMKKIAQKRFFNLENKFLDNELKNDYCKCIEEYITLNHMSSVNSRHYEDGYYMPHHCVSKPTSTTTKHRVVFDASAKASNLISLNENLMVGPKLQANLLDLLLKFRIFQYAFSADIEKMYRQIKIHPDDYKYHLILWRSDSNQSLMTYALKTVTFGTSAAPYLAIKTLYQLADDEEKNYPIGANVYEMRFM